MALEARAQLAALLLPAAPMQQSRLHARLLPPLLLLPLPQWRRWPPVRRLLLSLLLPLLRLLRR